MPAKYGKAEANRTPARILDSGIAASHCRAMWNLEKTVARLCGAAVLTGFVALAGPAAADLESGVAAYKAGDYGTALREFSKEAAAGNANAQFNLAVLYLTGRGVERDVAKSVEWHLKAAAQGLPAAEHGLGVFYYQGHGVKRDYAQALVWFKRAAAKGFADSEFNIGVMYFNNQGVARDDFEVVKWVTLAASRKFAPAEYRMGQMYENGLIFAKDLSAARHWYRLAGKHGDKNAPAALTRISKAMNPPIPETAVAAATPAETPVATPVATLAPKRQPVAPPKPPTGKSAASPPGRKVEGNAAPQPATLPVPPIKAAEKSGKPAPARPASIAAAREWRVQFASFRTPAGAERAWRDLIRRAGDAIGEIPRIVARADLGDRGIYHRLQAGPVGGRDAAVDLCSRVRDSVPEQRCLPVRVRIR